MLSRRQHSRRDALEPLEARSTGRAIKPPRQIRPDRSARIVHVVSLLAQSAVIVGLLVDLFVGPAPQ